MPPLEEQKRIVNLIETKTNPINRLISEVGTSIELLKEHRTALISAAVTGKIDLRDKEVA
jgi:type I restriction enzyme S subunit